MNSKGLRRVRMAWRTFECYCVSCVMTRFNPYKAKKMFNNFLEFGMMVRGKPTCQQIQVLMMNVFKSGRSYSLIFSDIIVPTSTIAESLIRLQKEKVFRKNILGIREF